MAAIFYLLAFTCFTKYFYMEYHNFNIYNCSYVATLAQGHDTYQNQHELSAIWCIRLFKGVGGVTYRWHPPAGKKINSTNHLLTLILLLSGDIATNPGPAYTNPCCVCDGTVNINHCVIRCKQTTSWVHKKCSLMTNPNFQSYKLKKWDFTCPKCTISQSYNNDQFVTAAAPILIDAAENDPMETYCTSIAKNVNDSYVPSDDKEENWSDSPLQTQNTSSISDNSDDSSNFDIFGEIKHLRNINRKRPIVGYVNMNSIRYKFQELKQIFDDKFVDIFTIAETKIDSSFNNNIFSTEGYKLDRRDRNKYGGGIMTFVRADLPIKRRLDLECPTIETICYQLPLNKRRWGILCSYRNPSTPDSLFDTGISTVLDQMYISFDHIIVIGDLNYDMLKCDKRRPVSLCSPCVCT